MQLHVHVRRWVVWWFYVGVICGGIALANIFGRDLTRPQEKVLLLIGALHWLLGGIVCWAFESVRILHVPPGPARQKTVEVPAESEWHPASDFLLPGFRRSLLPPSIALNRRPRKSEPGSLPASDAHRLR
jgi:hypothetical protein